MTAIMHISLPADDPEKTARIKTAFPDAAITTWPGPDRAIRRAIAAPPKAPVVPAAPDYSGTPLPQKLGIRAGARVLLLGAPRDFRQTLGNLPAAGGTTAVLFHERSAGTIDGNDCFLTSRVAPQTPQIVACLRKRAPQCQQAVSSASRGGR